MGPGTDARALRGMDRTTQLGSRQDTIMRAFPAGAGMRFFVLIFLGSAVISALDAGAAQPPQKDKKDEPIKVQPRSSDTPAPKAEPQTYTFEMRNKPWP